MPPSSRLNLELLRDEHARSRLLRFSVDVIKKPLSRREFLAVSGAGSVLSVVPFFLRGEEFSILQEDGRVHFLVGDQPRWTIDPRLVGPRAVVRLGRKPTKIQLSLRNGFFPGTQLPADFDCTLLKSAGHWAMSLDFACGIDVQSDFVEWLHKNCSAVGGWGHTSIKPFDGLSIDFLQAPTVNFDPDWSFQVRGPAAAVVEGIPHRLRTSSWRMGVNRGEQLVAGPPVPRTTFFLPRGSASWGVDVSHHTKHGWSLAHEPDEDLFDDLHVEAAQSPTTSLYSAVLTQKEENRAPLRFFTGGGLFADYGEPFHLSLENPRLAFTLLDTATQSALVANIQPDAVWAHTNEISLLISGSPSHPRFELFKDGEDSDSPQVSPHVSKICFPQSTPTCVELTLDKPRPLRFTWANFIQPAERFLGWLDLLPWEHHLAFDLTCGDRLHVLRPTDLLALGFEFQDMRLYSGIDPGIWARKRGRGHSRPDDAPQAGDNEKPVIDDHGDVRTRLHCTRIGKEPRISVIFPPQHIAEQAFFHASEPGAISFKVPIGDSEVGDIRHKAQKDISDYDRQCVKHLFDPNSPPPTEPPPAGTEKCDLPPCPTNPCGGTEEDQIPATSIIANESRLVFRIPDVIDSIPFEIEELLKWKDWDPVVVDAAKTERDSTRPAQPEIVNPGLPANLATAIELPYHLMISPSQLGSWAHSLSPVTHETNVVELWHTRLGIGVKHEEGRIVDETNSKDRTIRAVWSPDFIPVDHPDRSKSCTDLPKPPANSPKDQDFMPHDGGNPFRMSLDARDRCELVHLTSNYKMPLPKEICEKEPKSIAPAPVNVEQLMLTSLGGYLKSLGNWDPPKIDDSHQLTLEQWRHIATLGRDQYARVLYKGYLAPFGHRAALVKVTERLFVNIKIPSDPSWVAILHQRMFITIQNPRKDFPVLGQDYGGRRIPFKRVDVLTLVSPDIDLPEQIWPEDQWKTSGTKRKQSQSLFWPTVLGQPFPFRFRFWDMDNKTSEASLPVVFADAEVSQHDVDPTFTANFTIKDVIQLYNFGAPLPGQDKQKVWPDPRTSSFFNDQKIAFAKGTNPGDTEYDVNNLGFQIRQLDPTASKKIRVIDLYKNDLPYFFPEMNYGLITSASIKRVTGAQTPTRVVFFPSYLQNAFDPKQNLGEVVLQVDDPNPLRLAFGSKANVDKAGGLSSPDTLVVGFSRKSGPIGGKVAPAPSAADAARTSGAQNVSLTTYSSGKFDATDFFGGLTSAKILGAIKLSDIIAQLAPGLASNLEKAPKMLENALFEADEEILTFERKAVGVIRDVQNFKPPGPLVNVIARHLSTQAQLVDANLAAVETAHQLTVADKNKIVEEGLDLKNEIGLHGNLFGSILQYADALTKLLANPGALAQEEGAALVDEFLNPLETALLGQAKAIVDSFVADLNSAISELISPLNQIAGVEAKIVVDPFSLNDPLKGSTLQFSDIAPELLACADFVPVAQDLMKRIQSLNTLSLANLSGSLQTINGILEDILHLYERAGFLGLVTVKPEYIQQIKDAEDKVNKTWQLIDYVQSGQVITDSLNALHDACLILASQPAFVDAKQVLQNLRQLQRTTQLLQDYAKRAIELTQSGGGKLDPAELRRWIQRLQQLQRQVIENVIALGTVAAQTIADLDKAQAQPQPPADKPELRNACQALLDAAQPVPGKLTVIEKLLDPATFLDTAITNTVTNPDLLQPLLARWETLTDQLRTIRTGITLGSKDPHNLALQLQHYDVTVDFQSSLAAAVTWDIYKAYTADSDVGKAVAVVSALAKMSGKVQIVSQVLYTQLSQLRTDWKNLEAKIPTILRTIFQESLSKVDTAFDNLVQVQNVGGVPNVSQVLDKSHSLLNAVLNLASDIRTQVVNLGSDLGSLLNAQNLLPMLLESLPIPRGVSLSYDWHPKIKSFEPVFLLKDKADFIVTAQANVSVSLPGLPGPPPSFDIKARLEQFSINLIGNPSFVIVDIDSLQFTSHNGDKPDCKLKINKVDFGRDMAFVKALAKTLNPSQGPFLEFADAAVRAGFRFHVPTITMGAFSLMQLHIDVVVALPFNGDPVRCEFGLSDQQNPFLLSAGIYGGGGFLQLQLGLDGVQLLQGALEFGVVSAISIGPLQGTGFVVAGIYFRIAGNDSQVCGFVHAHGHMDIFGIISLDVDLYVAICYEKGRVHGIAIFTVKVDILFLSESFTMQAEYGFAGSSSSSAALNVNNGTEVALLEGNEMSPFSRFLVSDAESMSMITATGKTAGQSCTPSEPNVCQIDPSVWKQYFESFVR